MPGGAPPGGPAGGTAYGLGGGGGGGSVVQDTTGAFEGCSYRIDHRDSNSILTVTLQQGYGIKAKPGAMVAMAGTVQIQGSMKISFTKMMTGGEMSESRYTGPGELILAPEIWGDIVPIPIQPNVTWSVGKDAYLGCTMGVTRTTKSQGLMKGLMSGEGFFVAKVSGQGIFFAQSIGAILKRELRPGEEWIVDNGHLVAWSASYSMERINTSGGGLFSASHTGEGMVCRFRGPGTVYLQTRNPESLGQWIAAQVPRGGSGGGGGGGLAGLAF
ncbi:hypothetical protein FRC17_001215 [Serendipita sp. 399]|nr:hypothetical protein FRC17_001215 [Serendipita sp. 399]